MSAMTVELAASTTAQQRVKQKRRRVVISSPARTLTLPTTSARVEYRDLGTWQWKEIGRTQDVSLIRKTGVSRAQVQLTATLFQVGKVTPEQHIRSLKALASQAQPCSIAYGDILAGEKWIVTAVSVTSTQLWEGTNLIRHADVSMTLTQWVDDRLTVPAVKKTPTSVKRKTPKTHVVKAGESLSQIAVKECGNASHARQIAADNKLRDPSKIKVGQKLIIKC